MDFRHWVSREDERIGAIGNLIFAWDATAQLRSWLLPQTGRDVDGDKEHIRTCIAASWKVLAIWE
jgi:hypothetical protein